jgi:hypothetical protein
MEKIVAVHALTGKFTEKGRVNCVKNKLDTVWQYDVSRINTRYGGLDSLRLVFNLLFCQVSYGNIKDDCQKSFVKLPDFFFSAVRQTENFEFCFVISNSFWSILNSLTFLKKIRLNTLHTF